MSLFLLATQSRYIPVKILLLCAIGLGIHLKNHWVFMPVWCLLIFLDMLFVFSIGNIPVSAYGKLPAKFYFALQTVVGMAGSLSILYFGYAMAPETPYTIQVLVLVLVCIVVRTIVTYRDFSA